MVYQAETTRNQVRRSTGINPLNRLAWLPVIGLLLACAAPGWAAVKVDPDSLTPHIIDAFPVHNHSPLPEYVPAPEGELTAYADWEHAERIEDDGEQSVFGEPGARLHIPLYLVNRTEHTYIVSQQDWYAYFMLEVEVDGQWRRAQPFFFSWCGNSYSNKLLGPGTHLAFTADIPADGPAQGPARFRRVYEADAPIHTNVGVANYDPQAIVEAGRDDLAIECELDGETLYEMALTTVSEKRPLGPLAETLAASFPEQAVRLLNDPTIADQTGSLAYLKRELVWNGGLPADQLIALADDPNEESGLRDAAIQGLAIKHPQTARALVERRIAEQHPQALELLTGIIYGINRSPKVDLDYLLWLVRTEWDNPVVTEHPFFINGWDSPRTRLATQYPHEALDWVKRQSADALDDSQQDKLSYTEIAVVESPFMDNDWRVGIMRGDVAFSVLPQDIAQMRSGLYLIDHAPELVEPFIPIFEASTDEEEQYMGETLREILSYRDETENE